MSERKRSRIDEKKSEEKLVKRLKTEQPSVGVSKKEEIPEKDDKDSDKNVEEEGDTEEVLEEEAEHAGDGHEFRTDPFDLLLNFSRRRRHNEYTSKIFALKFMMTAANRKQKDDTSDADDQITFNKNLVGQLIEDIGGSVIDEFSEDDNLANCYLIADMPYRTHKYLSALARAVPCVNHTWIHECCEGEKFLDHKDFMLPAGWSLEDDQMLPWHNKCPTLLAGSQVLVYAANRETDPDSLDFVEIWAPLVQCMGATVIQTPPSSYDGKVDILLTDATCPLAELQAAENLGAKAVSSEWLIQAIITGKQPRAKGHQKYKYDYFKPATAADIRLKRSQPMPNIFTFLKFMLTSANRRQKDDPSDSDDQITFNKEKVRQLIEDRKGTVIDGFSRGNYLAKFYLIADMPCRSHKYLSALAAAMPCVKHTWIHECCAEEKLLNHKDFMLPAGWSLEDNKMVPWHNKCPTLLAGLQVLVYTAHRVSHSYGSSSSDFVQKWAPLVKCMGATVIKTPPRSYQGEVDILLTDATCPSAELQAAEKLGAKAVSSEWLIQAIITGKQPHTKGHQKYKYDYVESATSGISGNTNFKRKKT